MFDIGFLIAIIVGTLGIVFGALLEPMINQFLHWEHWVVFLSISVIFVLIAMPIALKISDTICKKHDSK
jgi:uncharacterized membrane protein YfcA